MGCPGREFIFYPKVSCCQLSSLFVMLCITLTVEKKFRRFLPANILWSPRLPIQPWNSVDNFLYGNVVDVTEYRVITELNLRQAGGSKLDHHISARKNLYKLSQPLINTVRILLSTQEVAAVCFEF